MTRPDIDDLATIRRRLANPGPIELAELGVRIFAIRDVDALLAHIDALEESLRAAVERCDCIGQGYDACPACHAALALLDGRDT